MKIKAFAPVVMLAVAVMVGSALGTHSVKASDHDDGETDIKSRNTNLTDLFVFKESSQDAMAAPLVPGDENIVLVMNVNPRSLARQQYYFATGARYFFNVARVGTSTSPGTANNDVNKSAAKTMADVTFQMEFGTPASDGTQAMTLTALRDGQTLGTTGTITTTPIQAANLTAPYTGDNVTVNNVTINTPMPTPIKVFAGLREDPFFFDVEQYFRVRASLADADGATTFTSFDSATAKDFTAGYNVLSIVLSVPRSFLKNTTTNDIFDVWETIQVRS